MRNEVEALIARGTRRQAERTRVCLSVIVAVLFAAALAAGPAVAETTHPFREIFSSANQPAFSRDAGMVVDQASGDLVVNDRTAKTLSRWQEDGTASNFSALGTNVIDGKGGGNCLAVPADCDQTPENGLNKPGDPAELQIAIDNSGEAADGDIYDTQAGAKLVDVFSGEGKYLGQLTAAGPTPFGKICGVAVDGSGAVYVGDDTNKKVHKFIPTANPPANGDWVASFDLAASVERPCTIAAGAGPSAGFVFVAKFNGPAYKLDSTTGEVKYQVSANPTTTLTVDPGDGHLFVASGERVNEYDASGAVAPAGPISSINPFSGPGVNSVDGVAVDGTSGRIYTSFSGLSNVSVKVFDPPIVTLPEVSTGAATEIGGTTAKLNGTVNPDGLEVTECLFEYGTTTAYGQTAPCAQGGAEIGTGKAPVAVHVDISGLETGTAYHYRILATNAEATAKGNYKARGLDKSFTTLEPVLTGVATEIGGTKAKLNGTVNPYGTQIEECFFEYGVTTAYGQSAPCAQSPAAIGAGEAPVAVSAEITGLAPAGTQHFRLVAVSPDYGRVDGADRSFLSEETVISKPAAAIADTTARLNGAVDPDGVGLIECFFEWGASTDYGETAPCVPNAAAIGSGNAPVDVHADLGALHPGTVYHYRLMAVYGGGPAGHGADQSLQTLGPAIAASWAEEVSFSEATLKAEIDPEGQATTYRFEYGTSAAYGNQTAELAVGSDSAAHEVSALLGELQAGTTYHYRVVATSPAGVNEGPDRVLATYLRGAADSCPNAGFRPGPGAQLPDCRAYEMVSPPDKGGGDIVAVEPPGGGGNPPQVSQAAGDGQSVTYSASTAFGDAQRGSFVDQYLARRHPLGDPQEGWTSHALNPAQGATINDPGTFILEYANPFMAFSADLCFALVRDFSLAPLSGDAMPGYENLYLRENCGAGADSYEAVTKGGPLAPPPFSVDPNSTPNLGIYAYNMTSDHGHVVFVALAALTADAAAPVDANEWQIYDYAGGELHLISKLPGGEANPGQNMLGTSDQTVPAPARVLSEDGSRVFWTANPSGILGGEVYARVDNEETVVISESVTSQRSRFWTADVDGATAVFSVEAGPLAGDLYSFDVDSETASKIAGKMGKVLGGSEDLSRLYFTSEEALGGGAAAGEWNLYLREGGATHFIGAVGAPSPAGRVSADGRFLAFASSAALSPYDNEGATEIYRYSADAAELGCISCNPSGARALGGGGLEWLRDDGNRVFFGSADALLPGDLNGAADVYQWEAPGTGGCDLKDADYFSQNGGCIGLISTGHSPDASEFAAVGAGGRDTFIFTNSSIDSRDPGLIDIYDAREGGGFPPRPAPAPLRGRRLPERAAGARAPDPGQRGHRRRRQPAAGAQMPAAGEAVGQGQARRSRARPQESKTV